MNYEITYSLDYDGSCVAEVPELPTCRGYGRNERQAHRAAVARALEILSDQLEHDQVSLATVERMVRDLVQCAPKP